MRLALVRYGCLVYAAIPSATVCGNRLPLRVDYDPTMRLAERPRLV